MSDNKHCNCLAYSLNYAVGACIARPRSITLRFLRNPMRIRKIYRRLRRGDPSRSPSTYRSQIGRLDPPHHPSCHPERPKGVEGSSHQFKIVHIDGSALSRQVAPTSKFVGVLVGGGVLDAPCWVSETQKGGHTALPYFLSKKENRNLSDAVFMLALSIFLGRPSIVLPLRNMPVACFRQKKAPIFRARLLCWRCLPSWVGQCIVLP